MSLERPEFRGYISSRPVRGTRFPQRIQNLIIRDYAAGRNFSLKLSLAEYAMPGSFMMLRTLLEELPRLGGIIFFSMFMLPSRRSERMALYTAVLHNGAQLHAALETVAIRASEDIPLFEDTIQVDRALRLAPLRGRFEKASNIRGTQSDPFAVALISNLP